MDDEQVGYFVSPDQAAIWNDAWDELQECGDRLVETIELLTEQLRDANLEPLWGYASVYEWESARERPVERLNDLELEANRAALTKLRLVRG